MSRCSCGPSLTQGGAPGRSVTAVDPTNSRRDTLTVPQQRNFAAYRPRFSARRRRVKALCVFFLVGHSHRAPRRAHKRHRSEVAVASLTSERERDDPLSSDWRTLLANIQFFYRAGFIFESLLRPRGRQSVFCRSAGGGITQSKSESSRTHAQFATYAARILRGKATT